MVNIRSRKHKWYQSAFCSFVIHMQTQECAIGDAGGKAIGEALMINNALTKLNIGGKHNFFE